MATETVSLRIVQEPKTPEIKVAQPANKSLKRVHLRMLGRVATLQNREAMRAGHPTRELRVPEGLTLPAPTLPLDWAKSISFPIDGNDIYGDCEMAAAIHADSTFTGNNGTQSVFSPSVAVSEYLALSGGNNGLNDGQIIGAWENGLAGIADARIINALSIDTTNASLVQSAIWLFGGVFFTLSIPDTWYDTFVSGATWDAPATADPNNGHAIWWNGVAANGNYKLETWGTYGWITPAGVADCSPGGFVVFSKRWFNSQGVAPNGLSYAQLSSYWTQMGGPTLPAWPAAPQQGDRLLPGQGLFPGQALHSADGRFTFTMQEDGNLVLYGPNGQPLWATGTQGNPNAWDAVMQTDGNLVIYNGQNSALWASGTHGNPGTWLSVQNDGNVVLYNANNQALWATGTVVPAEPTGQSQPGILLAGQGFMVGGSVRSIDGRFSFTLLSNGNLGLFGPGNQQLWNSNVSPSANPWDLIMQADGNLVVYDGHTHAVQATGTQGNPGAYLSVQNDGNVVVYSSANRPLWASGTVVPAQPNAPGQAGKLNPGEGLLPGQRIISPDGRFDLTLQGDGNFVMYGPGGAALWATGTQGHGNVWDVIMQGDGNLVIYDGHGTALWATGTQGNPGTTLSMQNDGNIVLYNASGQALWASGTVVPAAPAAPSGSTLQVGTGLLPGQTISAANGIVRLTMQADGNLVLYDEYNQALWSTGQHASVWDAIMQADGNFVLYNVHGQALWATGTQGHPGATITVQTDGNVVIYDTGGHALWATNTEIGVEILKG